MKYIAAELELLLESNRAKHTTIDRDPDSPYFLDDEMYVTDTYNDIEEICQFASVPERLNFVRTLKPQDVQYFAIKYPNFGHNNVRMDIPNVGRVINYILLYAVVSKNYDYAIELIKINAQIPLNLHFYNGCIHDELCIMTKLVLAHGEPKYILNYCRILFTVLNRCILEQIPELLELDIPHVLPYNCGSDDLDYFLTVGYKPDVSTWHSNFSVEMFRVYMKHNFDILKTDERGNNTLHWLCMWDYDSHKFHNITELLEYLMTEHPVLFSQAINAQNKEGDTPAHFYYASQDYTIFEKFIDHGFDINIVNKKGEHALPWVNSKVFHKILEKLK